MRDICSECGDRRLLNDSGVCKNRHGCEHRQYQHREAVARLTAEMDRQAWHNRARADIREVYRRAQIPEQWAGEDYDGTLFAPPEEVGGSGLLNFWMNNHPSQTNRWVDDWLTGSDEDED